MDTRSTRFLVGFVAMFLSAAGLILSIPPLLDGPESSHVWTSGILAGLSIALAVATLVLRPQQRRRPNAGADE